MIDIEHIECVFTKKEVSFFMLAGIVLGFCISFIFFPTGIQTYYKTNDTSGSILLSEEKRASEIIHKPIFPVTVYIDDKLTDAGLYSNNVILLNPKYATDVSVIRHELCHHILAKACGIYTEGKAFDESLCQVYGKQDGNINGCVLPADYCQLKTYDVNKMFSCVVNTCNVEYCFNTYATS